MSRIPASGSRQTARPSSSHELLALLPIRYPAIRPWLAGDGMQFDQLRTWPAGRRGRGVADGGARSSRCRRKRSRLRYAFRAIVVTSRSVRRGTPHSLSRTKQSGFSNAQTPPTGCGLSRTWLRRWGDLNSPAEKQARRRGDELRRGAAFQNIDGGSSCPCKDIAQGRRNRPSGNCGSSHCDDCSA
jgi:hypothetical protein